MFRITPSIVALAVLCGQAIAAPSFTVTDITSWTNAQLQGLPYFDHYVPFEPVGSTLGFAPVARSGDVYAGSYDGYYGPYAARIAGGTQSGYQPLGVYYWSYTTCDSTDCHFYNGRVGNSHFLDVNSSGVSVGDSTLQGSGSSSIGYVTHAIVTDPHTGGLVDITTTADRAVATGINDAGEIVGWQRAGGPTEGFRLKPDGSIVTLDSLGSSVEPTAINEFGTVVGGAIDTSLSYFNPRAFVSESGSAIQRLDLPTQGGVEYSRATDVNNGGWITGYSWKAAAPTERLASLWTKEAGGQWSPFDLNELAGGGNYILQSALAVNDEGYLFVQGELDQDGSPVHYFLLTPDSPLTPPTRQPGDFDFSGSVDEADFLQWKRDFGNRIDPAGTGADGNGDGIVDAADYSVWRDNVGAAVGSAAQLYVAVPEPSAWPMFVLGVAAIGFRRAGLLRANCR